MRRELSALVARSPFGQGAAWPVVAQLRPHLDEGAFLAQALRQQAEGWRATVLLEGGVVRAFAGWRVQEMLAHGRLLYVDDLVTDSTARSAGHGRVRHRRDHGRVPRGSDHSHLGCRTDRAHRGPRAAPRGSPRHDPG